jgi:hypothetical protein
MRYLRSAWAGAVGLATLIAFAIPLAAQSPVNLHGVYQEVSLTSSAAVVTVQQPASGAREVTFEGAVIYCSVTCIVTLEMNGTAATTTSGTVIKLNTKAPTAKAVVFTSSNVGVGTVIQKYESPAGISKSGLSLGVISGTQQNITLRTDSITGTVRILLMWSEPSL